MLQPLTLNEFQVLANKAKRVAVFQEILANGLSPVTIYAQLFEMYKASGVMLEDMHERECPLYSFVCFEPVASLTVNHNDNQNPLTAIRDLQAQLAYSTRAEVADLITSAAGFITYDAVRYFESIPDRHTVDASMPNAFINFYALSLAFNHEKQSILISYVVEVGDCPERAYQLGQEKIATVVASFELSRKEKTGTHAGTGSGTKNPRNDGVVEIDISDVDFMHMVEKAKDYIIRGDAFQIVISRCYKRHYSVSPFDIYQTLRRVSPAPFMFYFPTESQVIIGASPERFVRVHNNQVTVNPIAGTRKRTGEKTDAAIAADLLSDKKEIAEHMMLVDLARNDVGAVSVPGSVQVYELMHVKHYSHVSHITSTVTGQLQDKFDALDAFSAAFPAGTLSGAPKIRAMQIIDELETSRRGLYGGSVCRLDALGNVDSCIAIRMAILKNGIATIRTGAGIVFDSNPFSEAQETHQKARSMLDAIDMAHGE